MAKKKTGELIKEARTGAGLTQEQLAKKVGGISASDISKAERNELQLTQAQLKEIAKITGVTQKSLLESVSGAKTAAGKTGSSSKTGPTGKTGTSAKTGSSGKTGSAAKTGSSSGGMKLTAAEEKLVKLYRAADAATKKEAIALLEEKKSDLGNMVSSFLNNKAVKDVVSGLLNK